MRQIVLDTETTGLEVSKGHRIIEIGCVEVIDRRLSGKNFHRYINPEREIDEGALEVHGITRESLKNKPKFADISQEFIDFIRDSELVIHNAPFDIGFLNYELSLLGRDASKVADYASVLDTLKLAREKFPGKKNNLDALCKRFELDNSKRQLHGALLDAQILADVYLAMTGGQTTLNLNIRLDADRSKGKGRNRGDRPNVTVIRADDEESKLHQHRLSVIDTLSNGGCLWLKQIQDRSIE